MRIKLDCRSSEALLLIQDIVAKGGVIVYPTDTVYGIGGDPFNPTSVKKVYCIKRRENKPMPVLVSGPTKAADVVEVGTVAAFLMGKFWPGALTIVLDAKGNLPKELVPDGKLGVRMPDHELALKIIDAAGGALVGTSANISGCPSARSLDELDPHIENEADAVIEEIGDCRRSKALGVASTVILVEGVRKIATERSASMQKVKVLREGAIKVDVIREKLAEVGDADFEWV